MIIGGIAFLTAVDGSGSVAATTHLGGIIVGYFYLRGGRGGLTAELKYRYLKWKMNRLRRKFDVVLGRPFRLGPARPLNVATGADVAPANYQHTAITWTLTSSRWLRSW